MLSVTEYEEYLRKAEAEEAARAAKAAEDEAKAEAKRHEEHEKDVARAKKLEEYQKKWFPELVEERRRRQEAEEKYVKSFQKANAKYDEWIKSIQTESLADIADEIIATKADPAYIARRIGDVRILTGVGNLRNFWIDRIIKARARMKDAKRAK